MEHRQIVHGIIFIGCQGFPLTDEQLRSGFILGSRILLHGSELLERSRQRGRRSAWLDGFGSIQFLEQPEGLFLLGRCLLQKFHAPRPPFPQLPQEPPKSKHFFTILHYNLEERGKQEGLLQAQQPPFVPRSLTPYT